MFKATILNEIPNGNAVHYFPPKRGTGGVICQFSTDNETWVGVFRSEDSGCGMFSGLIGTPDSLGYHYVFANGTGFGIQSSGPLSTERISLPSITWARYFPEKDIMVAVSSCEIVGYRGTVELWNSGRISIDGIKVSSFDEHTIKGFCDKLEGDVPFSISLLDGSVSDSHR